MEFMHRLTFTHARDQIAQTLADAPVESTVEVDARSIDLVEGWRELLSRLSDESYRAACAATAEPLDLSVLDIANRPYWEAKGE